MLFSSASFHTSVSTYSNPFRKLSSIYRNSSPSTSPEPSPTTSWGLWLVSTLQGNLTTSDDRRRLVGDIARMSEEEQDNLIEFLQNGAAPCALENNACKQFLCNTSDLRTALTLNDPKALLDLWQQLYQEIVPALQSILYPLQRRRPNFDVRQAVLTIFRDKVLNKVLRDVEGRIPSLEGMLFTVLLETETISDQSKLFTAIANRIMGVKEREPINTEMTKVRSRTLPNKSSKRVTWLDMRKSATFSA